MKPPAVLSAITHSRSHKVSSRARSVRALLWLGVVALTALNGWLAWNNRPLPKLEELARQVRLNRLDSVRPSLEARVRRSPHDGLAYLLLGRVHALNGDLVGCARALGQVPFWYDSKPEALYLEGDACTQVYRLQDARSAWEALIENDPMHLPPARYFSAGAIGLAKIYVLQKRPDDARRVLWRLYEEGAPEDRESVLALMLETTLNEVNPNSSVTQLTRAVEADPMDWDSHRALAIAEYAVGQVGLARDRIMRAAKAQPDNSYIQGTCLQILKESQDLAALRTAVAGLPSSADASAVVWAIRGFLHEQDGQIEPAIAAYREAVERDSGDYSSLYRISLLAARLGNLEKSEQARSRYETLRDASLGLSEAFKQYQAIQRGVVADDLPSRDLILGRLASINATLGWDRAAEAWRGLLPESTTARDTGSTSDISSSEATVMDSNPG